MKEKIIIANWKMNYSFGESKLWIKKLENKISSNKKNIYNSVICPNFMLINYILPMIKNTKISLGAQDCHYEEKGAYTGDISAKTLYDAKCKYVILGHFERRKYYNETNEIIFRKMKASVSSNIIPIICIGESKEVRDSKNYLSFLENQIDSIFLNEKPIDAIIAYEPIWAIGTRVTPSISEISEVYNHLNDYILKSKILKNYSIIYGGSVNDKNAKRILSISDGLLIGSSSLDVESFYTIISLKDLLQ